MRGVETADVEGRIGLGIAEALRLLQTFLEGELLLLHARQDVIAGAVENAIDALDRIAGEPLAQRLDDRNAAGDRRLEGERDMVLLGERGECEPCAASRALLAVTTGFAMRERGFDQALAAPPSRRSVRRKDRSTGEAASLTGIVEKVRAGQIDARSFAASRADTPATTMRGRCAPSAPRPAAQQPRHRRADGAETRDADAQNLRHCNLSGNRLAAATRRPETQSPCALFRASIKESRDARRGQRGLSRSPTP